MQDNSIFSKYKYIRSLGKGGCGEVFLAESKTLGNLWAVKEIPKDKYTSVSGYIEPEILKRLNHPALPRICDVYDEETKLYIIEDYIEGTCLIDELEQRGRFDEKRTIDWGIQLCSVLKYLHEQKPDPIIYGDMKPHNIIVTKEGFVKLVDFGVSTITGKAASDQACGDRALTFSTVFIGTKGYAAPEQYSGEGISCRTDIYSLGITLIQLVTGIDPLSEYLSISNGEYQKNVSEGLLSVLKKCIETNPLLRYPSVEVLIKDLRELALRSELWIKNGERDIKAPLSKIFLFTGIKGIGTSTLVAAAAEYISRQGQKTCIVDITATSTLSKSLQTNQYRSNFQPARITPHLFYLNLFEAITTNPNDHTDLLILHKHFSQLQDQFNYILIDAELSNIGQFGQFVNHIFLVCDMNPYNMAELGKRLIDPDSNSDFLFEVSFIINKFYKGELSSNHILQSILFGNEDKLVKLLSLSKVFEVPYDQRIYLGWMYSGFGEPMKFGSLLSDKGGKGIAKIINEIVRPPQRKPRAWFLPLKTQRMD